MKLIHCILIIGLFSCNPPTQNQKAALETSIECIVLGTVQDAGAPHIGCQRSCCTTLRANNEHKQVISLALVDHINEKVFLIEATPDMPSQLKDLQGFLTFEHSEVPDGILLTHAHIGHYTGLMYLGKEAKGAHNAVVYAMPRMDSFLRQNGPWSQLVAQENIRIMPAHHEDPIFLSSQVQVTPLRVPHRDEFSETVGFLIKGPKKKLLFIPDIDKWEKWSTDIRSLIGIVDYALLDGTFYSGEELGGRDMSLIPHPSIEESMSLFSEMDLVLKNRIHFVHYNHTNPVNNPSSEASQKVMESGFKLIKKGQRFNL